MLFANRLNNPIKDFVYHVTNSNFEGFVLFGRASILNCEDTLVHLAVNP